MLFFDEDTEDEDEGEGQEGQEGEGQAVALPQGQGQTDERPESVLTDVTIDGLGDQDLGDMSGESWSKFNHILISFAYNVILGTPLSLF